MTRTNLTPGAAVLVLSALLFAGHSSALCEEEVGESGGRRTAFIIQGPDALPVADAEVRLLRRGSVTYRPGCLYEQESGVAALRSDPLGRVELQGAQLPPFAIVKATGFRQQLVALLPSPWTLKLGPPQRLTGRVIASDTQQPVVGAEVTSFLPIPSITDIGGHSHYPTVGPERGSVRTGADGQFRILDGGACALVRVKAPGFATLWRGVLMRRPDEMALVLRMTPAGELRGRVVRADGNPAGGVQVVAHAAQPDKDFDLRIHPQMAYLPGVNSEFVARRKRPEAGMKAVRPSLTSTDAEGAFHFSRLQAGVAHVVWSTGGDGAYISTARHVTSGSSALPAGEIGLRLRRTATLHVRVQRKNGDGVAGAIVYLAPVPFGSWGHMLVADAAASVAFSKVIPGTYRLIVLTRKKAKQVFARVVSLAAGVQSEIVVSY